MAAQRSLTPGQVRAYLDANEFACPFCGGGDIEAYPAEAEGEEVRRKVRCQACKTSYWDVFVLHHVEIYREDAEDAAVLPTPTTLGTGEVSTLVERITEASDAHGAANCDYDYATGDFQAFLGAALGLLTAEQRVAFWADPAVKSLVTEIPAYVDLALDHYPESEIADGD